MALIEVDDGALEVLLVANRHRCAMCGKLHSFVDFDIKICPECLYRFLITPAKIIREAKGRCYADNRRGKAIQLTKLFKAKRRLDNERQEVKNRLLAILTGEDNESKGE